MALSDYINQIQQQTQANATPMPMQTTTSGAEMLGGSLEYFLNPNSQYLQNARQRGMEVAATRGGINSSIAAGASERAAIEAVAPLAQQAAGFDLTREMATRNAELENWLAGQNFNRQLTQEISMLPLASSFNMLNAVQNFALQDPALYTPEVVSGYTNFFNRNMNDLLNRYFSGGS